MIFEANINVVSLTHRIGDLEIKEISYIFVS